MVRTIYLTITDIYIKIYTRKYITRIIAMYCPFCKSKIPVVKAGKAEFKSGKKQRYQCKNKACRRFTTKPLRSK